MNQMELKIKVLLLIVVLIQINSNAQISFQEHVISTNAIWARAVYAADIDGDGDIDVLSASQSDDKIAWYENTSGQGVVVLEQIISNNAAGAWSVYAADLDGDIDVLSASIYDNKIAWYENTDGQGRFGPEQSISTNAVNARSVHATDIDGDGDMDVLSASYSDDKIAWYENIDGQGNFGSEQVITTNADGAWSVYAADLDGDGDIDVLSASFDDDKIAWYENIDGQGSFGFEQIITTSADGAHSVFAADMDGDGDMDVLSASYFDNKITGYRNTDGQGNFGSEQIISTNANGATSVYAADLDGDGDMDVLSASQNDDKISAYENLSIVLSVHQNTLVNFSVYPNPTSGVLDVKSTTAIAQIDIYNEMGQLVLVNSDQNKIDTSSLNQGFYFCKVIDEKGSVGVKRIIKK